MGSKPKDRKRDVCGVEALLRYRSLMGDPIFPNEFIPLLERTGMINEVGLWVLEQALFQCKKWCSHIPDIGVSVNFSIVQFDDILIAEKVKKILEKPEMPGYALTIEITESVEMQGNEHLRKTFRLLCSLGIAFSIDDFGTGYSNLSYLKRLNVNEIKIDRIFINGIQNNTYNHKLIHNIIEFAKSGSIRVCCEGVESIKELSVLEVLQPDLLQGYLFAKPGTAEETEKNYINKDAVEYKKYSDFIEDLYQVKSRTGFIPFDHKCILDETDVGLWIIRMDESKGYYELHADETMERIMDVERKFTPR